MSWLEFNARVLEEALDPHQPLLERVRFLSIFGTNLDEFFEVRIAGVKQQIDTKSGAHGPDHMTAAEVFQAAQKRAHELVETQYRCWNEQLLPALNAEGIFIHSATKLPAAAAAWAERKFREEIFPVLTPLAVDPSHPFPQLLNKATTSSSATAIVQIPRVFPRLQRIPDEAATELGPGTHYVFLQSLIRNHLQLIFPGLVVRESHAFRMTRNSDLYIDEEEAENLLHTIEEELRRLNKGNAVRLEVQLGCPPEVEKFLIETLRLPDQLPPSPTAVQHGRLSAPARQTVPARESQSAAAGRGHLRSHAPAGRVAASSL